MTYCTACGHALGVGRFCTNCGHPVAAAAPRPTDTAERPAVVVPPVPPPAPPSPPVAAEPAEPGVGAPRYPLFADEVEPAAAPVPTVAPVQPPPLPELGLLGLGEPVGTPPEEPGHRSSSGGFAWLPWAVVLVLVIGALAGGTALLFRGDGDDTSSVQDPGTGRGTGTHSSAPERHRRTPSSSPSSTPTVPTSPSATPVAGTDVARFATATVPGTAPPNQDVDGNLVSYDAFNMLDGVPSTCWRIPGDATGDTITFRLRTATTLTRVGLINGYAKTAHDPQGHPLNWYTGIRRILAVQWGFADGSTIQQQLSNTRAVQYVAVPRVDTSSVTLTLLSVTPPGPGRAGRDNTAISDVALVGTPG